jgi:hypothetical protein
VLGERGSFVVGQVEGHRLIRWFRPATLRNHSPSFAGSRATRMGAGLSRACCIENFEAVRKAWKPLEPDATRATQKRPLNRGI